MLRSTDRIRTTHVGSLPRNEELHRANAERRAGSLSEEDFAPILTRAVDEVVARQREVGIDTVNDGEYGHASNGAVDYGSWWHYSFARTAGLSVDVQDPEQVPQRSEPGNLRYTTFEDRRDWTRFRDFYATEIDTGNDPDTQFPVAVDELRYIGQDAVAVDVANLQAAAQRHGADEAYIAALSPGSAARVGNVFYSTDEGHIRAWAEVLHEEYKAITDAGLIVQIDDPGLAEGWDQINPEPSVQDYLKFQQIRVDALNSALEGIPAEQVRFHLCWGSWHGPHTTDLEFKDIVGLMLEIQAGAYTFEAANARHAHEWTVWEDVELSAGKLIIPGCVSHSTNVVEHPELVAQRIERFAGLVGKENVIASTDCGLGGRIHPDIAWAKLAALTEGARIASQRLY